MSTCYKCGGNTKRTRNGERILCDQCLAQARAENLARDELAKQVGRQSSSADFEVMVSAEDPEPGVGPFSHSCGGGRRVIRKAETMS